MADTSVQKRAAEWVRNKWLNEKFGKLFERKKCRLNTDAEVEFNAVSQDGRIIAFISTSTPLVPKGTVGRGKLSKVRSDALFLSMAEGKLERLLIYTDKEMRDFVAGEHRAGRLPENITVLHAALPGNLQTEVIASRKKASKELARATP
jgi:hypothetical protein